MLEEKEEETGSDFDLKLTSQDRFLYQKFRCHLVMEGKTQFSSDDFRAYRLHEFLFGDPSHAIGALFARWVHNKLIKKVGFVRSKVASNNLRVIRLYEFDSPNPEGKGET